MLGGIFTAINAETVGEDDATRFHTLLRQAHEKGQMFCTFTGFVVSGRRL